MNIAKRKIAQFATIFTLSLIGFTIMAKPIIKKNRPKDELSLFRYIMNQSIATYQDMADVVIMQSGKFDKMLDPHERIKSIKAIGINFSNANNAVTRGSVAKAALLINDLEFGLLFAVTKSEYYAIRDVQALSLMLPKYTAGQFLSGKQLIGVLDNALNEKQKKQNWKK